MFLIRSEVLVFCEAATGPFDRDQMVFAPFSPEDGTDGVAAYESKIDALIQGR